MKHFLPSARTLVWGLVIAFVAIAINNNVAAINRLTAPRG